MKYFSMFSGIGGFEYGIDRVIRQLQQELEGQDNSQDNQNQRGMLNSGATCIGYSEIDKYADAIYKYNYGGKNYGDATKINERELPDFDLLVGGFPCQAFSIAGKRAGFDDTRGTLFFDVARILKHKRPRHFILENVKGLLSHDSGKTFKTILKVLSDIGYRVESQVLNSKYFGVPQNRERVYIVGHLRGECRCQVFPIRGAESENINPICERKSRENEFGAAVLTPDRENKRQNGRRIKNDGEPSFTLTGQDNHGVFDGAKIRRLTPTECERLQGFPDGWTAKGIMDGKEVEISDTQRYKTLGNAVTTNVVTEVVRRIYENIHTK